jgi:hypothetical protein
MLSKKCKKFEILLRLQIDILGYHSFNAYHSSFFCHPEDKVRKNSFLIFYLKEKYEILRFAQNDDVGFLEQPNKITKFFAFLRMTN